MEALQKVSNTVEDVKLKLSDAEYKALMDGLMEVHQAAVVLPASPNLTLLTHIAVLERELQNSRQQVAEKAGSIRTLCGELEHWKQKQTKNKKKIKKLKKQNKTLQLTIEFWRGVSGGFELDSDTSSDSDSDCDLT